MKIKQITKIVILTSILPLTAATGATLATYEFTGHSLSATDADAGDGVTFSTLTIGVGLGDLTDNGADANSLRISGDDTENDSSTATSNSAFLSFTLTNNSGSTVVLDAISLDYQATNAFGFSFSRVFSNVQGFDSVIPDTIGNFGRETGGSDGAVVNDVIDLTATSTEFGANVSATDFTVADGNSITFFVPWIDQSGSPTRFTDIDNLSISGDITPVPEPSSVILMSLAGLGFILRRNRLS